jgi:hypothetical protein
MGTLYIRNNCTRHFLMGVVVFALSFFASGTSAQSSNQNRLMLGCGALYERGFDATVAYEHETKYHHAWEYFATGYLKYRDDPAAGHVTEKSFWDSYNTWHVGIAYKPCVSRGRNHHGNARLGVSGGSDRYRFVGGIHVGYEHSYALRYGWQLFFQVKEDVVIRGEDLFRTGLAVGVKVPL